MKIKTYIGSFNTVQVYARGDAFLITLIALVAQAKRDENVYSLTKTSCNCVSCGPIDFSFVRKRFPAFFKICLKSYLC